VRSDRWKRAGICGDRLQEVRAPPLLLLGAGDPMGEEPVNKLRARRVPEQHVARRVEPGSRLDCSEDALNGRE
jgi:hypothetical protein